MTGGRADGEGLELAVFKRAEDGDGWIVRVVERRGRSIHGALRLPRPGGTQGVAGGAAPG